jgi:hypothetical protein
MKMTDIPAGQPRGCALHQIDGPDRFMFDGISIDFCNLISPEYFHNMLFESNLRKNYSIFMAITEIATNL